MQLKSLIEKAQGYPEDNRHEVYEQFCVALQILHIEEMPYGQYMVTLDIDGVGPIQAVMPASQCLAAWFERDI